MDRGFPHRGWADRPYAEGGLLKASLQNPFCREDLGIGFTGTLVKTGRACTCPCNGSPTCQKLFGSGQPLTGAPSCPQCCSSLTQTPEGTVLHIPKGNGTKADGDLRNCILSVVFFWGFAQLCLLPWYQIPVPTLLKDGGLRQYLLHTEEPFAACAVCWTGQVQDPGRTEQECSTACA